MVEITEYYLITKEGKTTSQKPIDWAKVFVWLLWLLAIASLKYNTYEIIQLRANMFVTCKRCMIITHGDWQDVHFA